MAKNITRRAVLAGSTTTAALGVLAADAAPAASPSAMVLRIEAHREANAAFERARVEVGALDAALAASLEADPITVAVEKAGGPGVPQRIDLHRMDILGAIAADLTASSRRLGIHPGRDAMASAAAEMAERRARYDRNMAALDAADAEWKARRAKFTHDEAELRWATHQEEDDLALCALMEERPRTLADVQARARYLVAADLLERIGANDDERIRDFILSMTGEEA